MSAALPERIDTARLRLELPREDEAGQVAALMSPGVSQWLGSWPSPVSPSEVLDRIRAARTRWATGIEASWLVHRRDSPGVVGWIRVARESASSDRAELGYWIGEAYHGHGYATEAARAALAAVFGGWPLSQVESGAQLENLASFAIMRKLGMRPAGERLVWTPTRGRDELCRFLAITRPDFEAGR